MFPGSGMETPACGSLFATGAAKLGNLIATIFFFTTFDAVTFNKTTHAILYFFLFYYLVFGA